MLSSISIALDLNIEDVLFFLKHENCLQDTLEQSCTSKRLSCGSFILVLRWCTKISDCVHAMAFDANCTRSLKPRPVSPAADRLDMEPEQQQIRTTFGTTCTCQLPGLLTGYFYYLEKYKLVRFHLEDFLSLAFRFLRPFDRCSNLHRL